MTAALTLRAEPFRAWGAHAAVLAATVAALLMLFARDAGDIVRIWWTSSTFGHCPLIVPIIVWLVWQRRGELARLGPVAWWPGLAAVALGGAIWWVGDVTAVAFARHLALWLFVIGAVLALLGPRVARGLSFPIGYSIFLIPWGEWLEVPLQRVTVALVMPLLALAGIPASADGVMIHAGRYWFEVAEACSGAKFVIAMAAFGVLTAQVGFASWWRRAPWLVACLIVPVIANGARAFATIMAADMTDMETAGGFDHIVYGWVFFGLVVAAMLAAAWCAFDRPADDPAFDPAALAGPVAYTMAPWPAAMLVLATAAVFPAWSALASGRDVVPPVTILPEVPGWHRVAPSPTGAWSPWYPGARIAAASYADAGGRRVDLVVAAYARQGEGRELVGYGVGVLRADDRWLRVADEAPVAGGTTMRIVAPGPAVRIVASWYRVGDTMTAEPARLKMAVLKARLLGRTERAVALHLSARAGPGKEPREAIRAFLAAAGSPAALLERVVR